MEQIFNSPAILWIVCISTYGLGIIWGLHNAKSETNYHRLSTKELLLSFAAGGLTGIGSGIAFGIVMAVWSFLADIVMGLVLPIFHAPNPYAGSTSTPLNELGIMLLFFLYFGFAFGTPLGVSNSLTGKRNFLGSIAIVTGLLSLIFAGMPTIMGPVILGFYLLSASACNKDPRIPGAIAGIVGIVFLIIISKIQRSKGQEMVANLFLAACVFSLVVIILTLVACY